MSNTSKITAVTSGENLNINNIRRITWIGLILNICLTSIKFAGGILGKSQAVVADAVHSLSDLVTDILILVGVPYWSKPPDITHPHGHRRIETMVTMSIGIILALVATGILWKAISTLHERSDQQPGWIAFVVAFISIISKEILYRQTLKIGRQIKSMPVIANAWHHRSDALSSIPVTLAVAGALINPTWSFLDHVGAVVVSLFIFQAAYQIIRPNFEKLIDKGAPEEDLENIRKIVEGTYGVLNVHDIRTRYVGCSGLAIDLHVEVNPNISVKDGHDIADNVEIQLIENGPEVVDVVVHIDPYEK
ncbi:MAG: cation diffusion facilitator family transporter [bacterium]